MHTTATATATATAGRSLRELIAFFAWTLGITFLVLWGPLAVLRIPGPPAGGGATPGWGLLPFILGGFVPSVVGLVLTVRTEGRAGLGRLLRRVVAFRFPVRLYVTIVLINLAVGGARLLVQWALGIEIRAAEPLAALLANPVLWVAFTIQILFLGPLSEEFGWRGYAQDRLLARFSPLSGSLLLGLFWALWHLPLFFIPGTSQAAGGQPLVQFLLFALFVLGMTVVMTWLHIRTGGSVGAAVLMHMLYNYVGTLVVYLVAPSLLDAAMQAAGSVVAAVLVVIFAGRRLGARTEAGESAPAA